MNPLKQTTRVSLQIARACARAHNMCPFGHMKQHDTGLVDKRTAFRGGAIISALESSRSIVTIELFNCPNEVAGDRGGTGGGGAGIDGRDAENVAGSGKHCLRNAGRSSELVAVMMVPAMLRLYLALWTTEMRSVSNPTAGNSQAAVLMNVRDRKRSRQRNSAR